MFSRKKNKYIFAREKKSKTIMKWILRILLVILIALGVFFVYVNMFGTASKVHLVDPTQVEINSTTNVSQLIKKIDKGGKLEKDFPIDTSKLGEKEYTLKINFGGKVRECDIKVKVVDTKAPEISGPDQFNLIAGSKVNIADQAKITDNSGGKIKTKIEGNLDINKPGEYPVKLVATDESGNKAEKDLKIKVISLEEAKDGTEFLTENGSHAVIKHGVLMIDDIPVVTKSFGLPANYVPRNTAESDGAYSDMYKAAKEDGINLSINTGYRSYGNQQRYYNQMVNDLGKAEEADKVCARPGFSEHQLGLALDLNSTDPTFADTKEAKWLNENCYKYGFIVRYPKGKEKETGYEFKPWHMRYVGKDLAEKLYNKGDWITLEHYFGVPSKYAE